MGIKKEVDVEENMDGYYFDICFDGTKPDLTQQSNGAFTFDKIKALELNSEGAKQSRELINFKKKYQTPSCYKDSHSEAGNIKNKRKGG